ncbi:MAG: calcium/sodium antiporter [Alphaproteobacteria bacterium]|nr:MAG: calcium/sodium antiporter [Alphaproteobacteria bacterium]
MLVPVLAVVGSLVLLLWSADRFVEGAAATARHLSVPPLLIGMVVVGFGTSAPEIVVSALASADGNPGIALGNALGSNITNIGLILGTTALISPIAVGSGILKKEFPILLGATLLVGYLLWDGALSRLDATAMLALFSLFMVWTIRAGLRTRGDKLATEVEGGVACSGMSKRRAMMWLVVGLLLLVASSRVLVWGAIEIATALGVSDLIIGLTIVAVGTSLPEFAASVLAARKGEHELAMGNVLGSNLFNTMAVIGIAGAIHPLAVDAMVLHRDLAVMAGMSLVLFFMGFGIAGRRGRINRLEGVGLLLAYCGYSGLLLMTA